MFILCYFFLSPPGTTVINFYQLNFFNTQMFKVPIPLSPQPILFFLGEMWRNVARLTYLNVEKCEIQGSNPANSNNILSSYHLNYTYRTTPTNLLKVTFWCSNNTNVTS
jgi:hypothetical protein